MKFKLTFLFFNFVNLKTLGQSFKHASFLIKIFYLFYYTSIKNKN